MSRQKKLKEALTEADFRKFAVIYVNGPPGIAGNWEASANAAGFSFVNSELPAVRAAIQNEGGEVEKMASVFDDERTIDKDVLGILKKPLPKEEDLDAWKKLAQKLEPVIVGISTGEVKATAAQASMIKHILDRAFGRVTAGVSEKTQAAGLVILPTLGERADMTLCPACGLRFGLEKVVNE